MAMANDGNAKTVSGDEKGAVAAAGAEIDAFLEGRLAKTMASAVPPQPATPTTTLAATPPNQKDTFEKLLNRRCCSCNRDDCRDVLLQYYLDASAPYPDPNKDKKQLFVAVENPRKKPPGRNQKQAARRQQFFDRSADLLGVSKDKNSLVIAMTHFHRDVIGAYADRAEKTGHFVDFLLPAAAVEDSRLGREFGPPDRLICQGTSVQQKTCASKFKVELHIANNSDLDPDDLRPSEEALRRKTCTCNMYMNLPFVTPEEARRRIGAPADGGKVSMALKNERLSREMEELRERASRLEREQKRARRIESEEKARKAKARETEAELRGKLKAVQREKDEAVAESSRLREKVDRTAEQLEEARLKANRERSRANYHAKQRGQPSKSSDKTRKPSIRKVARKVKPGGGTGKATHTPPPHDKVQLDYLISQSAKRSKSMKVSVPAPLVDESKGIWL